MKGTNRTVRQPFPGRWSDQVRTSDVMDKPEDREQLGRTAKSERNATRNLRNANIDIKGREETEAESVGEAECRHGRRRRAGRITLVVLLMVIFAAGGYMFGTLWDRLTQIGGPMHEETANEDVSEGSENTCVNPAENMQVIGSDINFSQSDNPEKSGVYVLLKLRNDNDEAVDGMMFLVSAENDILQDVDNGGDYFKASGYVPAHGEGYMCAHIRIKGADSRGQSEIIPVDGYTCDTREDYLPPSGVLTGFNKKRDAYDVEIVNRSGRNAEAGRAFVVAVEEGAGQLSGSWGAGELEKDIMDGQTCILENAIINPGFKHWGTAKFQAFLVDM